MSDVSIDPRPAEQILFHRGTMLLLDELTDYREGFVRCRVTVGRDNPFLDAGGILEAVALVEMLAQGAAALRGQEAVVRGGGPKFGYLVGIKDLEFAGRPGVGEPLTVEVRQTFNMEPMSLMEGRILEHGVVLASGGLKVWEEPGEVPAPSTHDSGSSLRAATPGNLCAVQSAIRNSQSPSDVSLMHRAVVESRSKVEPSGDGNRTIAEFRFDESFPGFQGHFPGNPILPGIILLKTAVVVSEDMAGVPLELTCVEKAKFTGRVVPPQGVRLDVRLTATGGQWTVRALVTSGAEAVASFRFRVTTGPGQKRCQDEFRTRYQDEFLAPPEIHPDTFFDP